MSKKVFNVFSILCFALVLCFIGCTELINPKTETDINLNIDLSKIIKSTRNTGETQSSASIGENPTIKVAIYDAKKYNATTNSTYNLDLITEAQAKIENNEAKVKLNNIPVGIYAIVFAELSFTDENSTEVVYAGNSGVFKVKASDNKVSLELKKVVVDDEVKPDDSNTPYEKFTLFQKNSDGKEVTDITGASIETSSTAATKVIVTNPQSSESVWTYFVKPNNNTRFTASANYKVSVELKADKTTVVGIAAARADYFFTVNSDWTPCEFNTGYLIGNEEHQFTIGLGLSSEIEIKNLKIEKLETTDTTEPSLVFDISKYAIETYLKKTDKATKIIDVSKLDGKAGYNITINTPMCHSTGTSTGTDDSYIQDVKLHLRSYATETTGANRVSFYITDSGNDFETSVMADTASDNSISWNNNPTKISDCNFSVDFPNYKANDELTVGLITSSTSIYNSTSFKLSNFKVEEAGPSPFSDKIFAIQVGNNWIKSGSGASFSTEVTINVNASINFDVGLFNGFNNEDWTPSDFDDVTRFLYKGKNLPIGLSYSEEEGPKFIITNNSGSDKMVKISLNEMYEVVIEEITSISGGGIPLNEISSWDDLVTKIDDDTTTTEFIIMNDLTATSTITVSKPVKITSDKNVTITRGSGFPGVFFCIDTGSLELGSNDYTITVDGGKDNSITATDPLIWAYSNSESLTLTNCILQNNPLNNTDNGYGNGGAVKVESKFTMNNSSIKTCSANVNGGAVYIFAGGSFTMNGGSISDCSANDGGAVYITDGGTFTMNDDATISNCTATLSGGGVWMNGGSSFTMQETSKIESCKAINTEGGGVYVTDANSNFKMISTTSISNCSAGKDGGGVSYGCGTSEEYNFTMQDNASISNCSATNYGGGVYLYGNLVMNGGTISGCSASSGAGVYVRNDSSLSVSGNAIVNSNFVYLTSGTTVKVAGVLTNDSIVATIMLDSYTEGTQVLTAENVVTFADYVGKFALADTSVKIGEDGKIAKVNTEQNLSTVLSGITNTYNVKQLPSGIYYLESDLVLDYPVYISTGDVVIYAKNNASITGSSSISTDSFFSVTNGCSLTFGKDESTEVKLTINAKDKLYSNAVLNAGENGTLNIKNNVICKGATKQSFITTARGTVNISGGKITENQGESPVIYITGGTVNITGGEISNNSCVNTEGYCSGILVSSGTLNISGTTTTISNNKFGFDGDNLKNKGASIYNEGGSVTILNTPLSQNQEFTENIIYGEIEASSGTGGNTGTSVTSISTNVLANGGDFVVTTADGSSIITITETIEISSNVSLSSESSTNKITLKRADSFNKGPMFKVKSGGTLILSDIILDGGASFSFTEADLVNKNISNCISGIAADDGPLIYNNGGNIELNSGSVLQNNWMVYSSAIEGGAGIFMDGGTAVMNGAEIKNNYGNTNTVGGGGVYITGGDFTINSGVISGNYCTKRGGGVSITSSQSPVIFTMNGGSITNNACATFGGALTVYENSSSNGATIKLNVGEISNNYALANGGGVYLFLGNAQSTGYIGNGVGDEDFIISKNTVAYSGSSASGVGLYIHCSALNDDINYFEIKKGADISNNNVYNSSAKIQGLGVWLQSGNILMSGGTIHDNKEESSVELWGGGIYVNCDKFTMTGGSVTSNSLSSSTSSAHGQQIYFACADGDETMIINGTTYDTETSLDDGIEIN